MTELDPINQTLLTILENQYARRVAAFENLDESLLQFEPAGGCNSICAIGQHLVMLRRFQLTLLGSALAEEVPDHESIDSLPELAAALDAALALLRTAVAEHDPADWYEVPTSPREGPWGDEPTIKRFVRPLNDFVNHLGAVRAIRRMQGCANDRTQ